MQRKEKTRTIPCSSPSPLLIDEMLRLMRTLKREFLIYLSDTENLPITYKSWLVVGKL